MQLGFQWRDFIFVRVSLWRLGSEVECETLFLIGPRLPRVTARKSHGYQFYKQSIVLSQGLSTRSPPTQILWPATSLITNAIITVTVLLRIDLVTYIAHRTASVENRNFRVLFMTHSSMCFGLLSRVETAFVLIMVICLDSGNHFVACCWTGR